MQVAKKSRLTRSMLQLFVMLTKLLICSNHIVDGLNATFPTINAMNTNAVTRILALTNQHSYPHTWLRRQRRYLLFEKGSSVGIQGNIAKAILSEMPRGLNEIYEYTFNYELPTTLDLPRPSASKSQKESKKKTQPAIGSKQITTTIAPTIHLPNLAALNVNSSSTNNNLRLSHLYVTPNWPSAKESVAPWWQAPIQRVWLREQQKQQQQLQDKQSNISSFQQQHRFTHMPILSRKIEKMPAAESPLLSTAKEQRHSCPRRNVYGNQHHNGQKWCGAGRETMGRERKRSSKDEGQANGNVGSKKKIDEFSHQIDENFDEFQFATNAERVFFDLMDKWATLHNYPPRHCIMRTFCESRHLLAAPGHSLFHDLLRILIDAALPAARRHTTYKKAIRHENLNDCAQHYATLCGLSFLQHFTEAVHGRFM